MRYRKIALGVGLLVVCVVVGAFIPIGTGSAVLIGFVVGLVLCYWVLNQKRFWTISPSGGEVNQKAIQEKTADIREAHITHDSSMGSQFRDHM